MVYKEISRKINTSAFRSEQIARVTVGNDQGERSGKDVREGRKEAEPHGRESSMCGRSPVRNY